MQVTTTHETSEVSLMTDLHKLADAGAAVIQIRTREPIRAAVTLRKNLLGGDTPYFEWDIVNGVRAFTKENFVDHQVTGDQSDFVAAAMKPLEQLRDPTSNLRAATDKIHFFAYVDPQPHIDNNPFVIELLQQYAAILPSTNVCIILITPDVTLQGVPNGTLLVSDLRTPTAHELAAVLTKTLENATSDDGNFEDGSELEEEDIERVAHLGLGMTLFEFETFASIAIIDGSLAGETSITVDRIMSGIAKGKTEVIRQSEILELMPSEDIENVGGMQRLKDWIGQRANCFSDEAKEFGIEAPKGLALVGVPGTGKSLVAKATSAVLEVPLVRLDFGRVFSKYVGDSESRVRSALKMVEDMAPCVLFVDEIDKGLGGAGGGGDSGTSSRVLGSFLTWLQEYKAPVFTIVTANRVDGLPPELLRRGRFDAIFSVGMPTPQERKEVLGIHLRKRGRDIADFDNEEMLRFVAHSNQYVPAEIESAVKDALIAAFSKNEDLGMDHLVEAFNTMVPMSKSHKTQIDRIIEWARDNATPVNYDDKGPVIEPDRVGARRVIKSRLTRG